MTIAYAWLGISLSLSLSTLLFLLSDICQKISHFLVSVENFFFRLLPTRASVWRHASDATGKSHESHTNVMTVYPFPGGKVGLAALRREQTLENIASQAALSVSRCAERQDFS